MGSSPTELGISRDSFEEFSMLREEIDNRLAALLPEEAGMSDPVSLAMREGVLASGKRVRPMLLILAARGLGSDAPAAVDLGCAVEMIHTASLILDDLPCMDNASLRRGRPTTHRQFGEDVAMLAVVALLSRAFGLVSAAPGVSAERRTQMMGHLTHAVGEQGLVKGQYADLHALPDQDSTTAVMTTNALKTGVLFQAAMAMAALAADAPASVMTALNRFALALGHAFQLYDDLTDGLAINGKDVDQDRGKTTLVSMLGEDEVRRRLGAYLSEADRHLHGVYGSNPPLSRLMHALFSRAEYPLETAQRMEHMAAPFAMSRL